MAEASMHLYPKKNETNLPVKRLATVMKELGHTHLDVLKIDIEGEEYNVLRNIKGIPIKQILVEMHTPTKSELVLSWIARLRLWARGYKLVSIRELTDYTFVRRS